MDENEHNTEIPAHRAVAHPLLDSATCGELADSCSVCAAVRCCRRLTEGESDECECECVWGLFVVVWLQLLMRCL